MTKLEELDMDQKNFHLEMISKFGTLCPTSFDQSYDYYFGIETQLRVGGYEYWCVVTRQWYQVTKGCGFKMLKRKKKCD